MTYAPGTGSHHIVLACLLGLSGVQSVRAQATSVAPAAVSCENDARCSRQAEAAFEHMQAGRLEEARRAYEAAYETRKDPKLLYNLARVLHRSGRPAEALGSYQRYLDAGADGNPEQVRKTQQYMEQARSEITQPRSEVKPQLSTPMSLSAADSRGSIEGAAATPIYKKWWFWTAIGAATAGVAIAIGVGVAASRPPLEEGTIARPFDGSD